MHNAEIHELVVAAFGGPAHPLAPWYAALLDASAPLCAFTAAHANKIRKKARLADEAATRRDLRCELAVAAALVDRRSPLVYEPPAANGQRRPDFLLRYKGHSDVFVEVSRMRPAASPEHDPTIRLAALLCGKLGQLAAGAPNLLVVVSDADAYDAATVSALLVALRQRADARDDAFFAFRGLDGARAFLQALPRLSAILVVMPVAVQSVLAPHRGARHALPADLARAIAGWKLATTIGPNDAGEDGLL